MDALKTLKLWQLGILLVILVGTAIGSYGVYTMVNGSDQARLEDDQQLIPVQRGSLINQVSTNGTLLYPNRETLTFGSQGTVGALLVEEGQQVEEGETVATLDASTTASLRKAVAQAQVDLQKAQDALAEAEDPHTPLDMAQAEAAVANAKLSLKSAQEALDQVKDGPVQESGDVDTQVDSATTALANAQGDLSLAQKEWDGKEQEALDAVDTALEDYRSTFQRWLGMTLDDGEIGLAPEALLDSWGVDLASLFDDDLRFQDPYFSVSGAFPEDDPATLWSETVLYTWLNLYPGPIAPTCEDSVPFQAVCVTQEMEDAWDGYQSATDDLDRVRIQSAKAISAAMAAVSSAESKFDPLEVEVRERQLDVAGANLAALEGELDELKHSADPLEVTLREAEVALAQSDLESALSLLDEATLRAPMSGIVSLVNVEGGQAVNANTPAFEIVDPTVVEVDGIVDEIDVLFIRLGARVTVSLDALPGQVLEGIVSEIASAARNQQGVVSYPIRVLLEVPPGVELREGLTATADIVLREERNVLLIPLQALYGSFDQPVVRMMDSGSIVDRPVVLGDSDDFWVVVREGLVEGDQVVMQVQEANTSQFGFFGRGGGFVGGLTGGDGGQRRGR